LDQLTADKWVQGYQVIQSIHEYWDTLREAINAVLHGFDDVRFSSSYDASAHFGKKK
jgi:hypothetical protein